MKIVVNDANILIDFCKLNMLEAFFLLEYDFHVVDVVWEEMILLQQDQLQPYVKAGRLLIVKDAVGLSDIFQIKNHKRQLSIPDCTALLYAKNQQSILLTSDKNLRATAKQQGVEVHGHLWVFDSLVSSELLSKELAASKLHSLIAKVNPKLGLPEAEVEMRIRDWEQ